ncbi:uncharacterized protein [Hoplias malabaricus]|uniref:uncharacterized protein n=1 Tax=Hoplias malabaricus TaxID=27720 RepID=UPI003461EFF2
MNMKSYLWVFILSLITCTGSEPTPLQINITATVDSSAVLPCDCRNVTKAQSSSESPHVQWRTNSETVFERQGEVVYQSEGYKGRVDVPEDQLLKGNCSLVMKDVRAEDAGVYESYLVVKRSKRDLAPKRVFLHRVELSVDAKQEIPNKPSRELATPEIPNNERSDSGSHTGVIITAFLIVLILLSLGLLWKFKAWTYFANNVCGKYAPTSVSHRDSPPQLD